MLKFSRSTYLAGAALLAATGALAGPVSNPALAQGFDIRSLFKPAQTTTGTVTPPAAAPMPAPAAAPEWSGESGSSGHPTMTADAIRAAARNFRGCLEELWPPLLHRDVLRFPRAPRLVRGRHPAPEVARQQGIEPGPGQPIEDAP